MLLYGKTLPARLSAALVALFLLLALLSSCSDTAFRSAACVAYAAGASGEESESLQNSEKILLPPAFVRAYAVLCASPSKEICLRVIYEGTEALYFRSMLSEAGLSRAELIARMNAHAQKNAPGLTFGSVTGRTDTEEALLRLLDEPSSPFVESFGTPSALKKAAEAFLAVPNLSFALSTDRVTTADGNEKIRSAPLVCKNGPLFLENTLLFLSDYTARNNRVACVAVAAVKEMDQISFSAVIDVSGDDDPVPFAACDAGNLCGVVAGVDYQLLYDPPGAPEGAGMVLGASFFSGAVLIFLIAAAVLLVAAAVGGIILTVRRNAAGRKKYAPPPDLNQTQDKK